MAIELESEVMQAIGLGGHYSWFNGSGSCEYIRQAAVDKLAQEASKRELTISPVWLQHCRTAIRVDACDSQYTLTNVWIACSYAIQDAIYRKEGSNGFAPEERWHFFDERSRRNWETQKAGFSRNRRDIYEW